jgi:hypothetical protein
MKLSRIGKSWTWVPSEDEQMRSMFAAGEGAGAVAKKLGRTKGSVATRASQLKITTRRKHLDRDLKAKAK